MGLLTSFKQDFPIKKHIPWSATLIASVLLAVGPKEHVLAQEITEEYAEIEIKNIFEKYHSLLNQMDQAVGEQDEIEGATEAVHELSVEEVQKIQGQLVLFVEREGDSALAEQLQEEVTTIGELEGLLNRLFEAPVTEEVDEVAEVIEDSLPPEDEMTEELVQIEEAVEEESADVEIIQDNAIQAASFAIASPAKETVNYTVRPGDTLNKIARAHKVTVQQIVDLNRIQNINTIWVGQQLTIHGDQAESKPADDLSELNKPMTKSEFIDVLGGHAQVAAKEQNLYASVMIAQAALETGFGTSGLSAAPNHNLYGMKGSYEGESVVMRTRENSPEKGWYYVNAHFKKYPSYIESLTDHSTYIRRGPSWAPDYYRGVWRENTSSYRDATLGLQGRYATDPTYANKLNNIIETYNLTRFDNISEGDLAVQPPVSDPRPDLDVKPSTGEQAPAPDSTPEKTEIGSYRVKRGDTLSRIALTHKMSVRELKELNSLHSDLILVGQILQVKQAVVETKPTPPPTPPKPVRPSETQMGSYTVKRGDTLSQIAPRYKMSVRELKSLNKLSSDLIFVGQKLKVKEVATESTFVPIPTPTPSKPTVPEKPVTSNPGNYIVKRGDTLSRIARQHKMSVYALKKLNHLHSDLILVGQQLKVQASPQAPIKPSVQSYQIKAGDTLSSIARRFNTSVKSLKAKNQLTSDLIYVNQRLTI